MADVHRQGVCADVDLRRTGGTIKFLIDPESFVNARACCQGHSSLQWLAKRRYQGSWLQTHIVTVSVALRYGSAAMQLIDPAKLTDEQLMRVNTCLISRSRLQAFSSRSLVAAPVDVLEPHTTSPPVCPDEVTCSVYSGSTALI